MSSSLGEYTIITEKLYKWRAVHSETRAVSSGKLMPPLAETPCRSSGICTNLDTEPQIEMTEDEKLDFVAQRILREHKAAFEELAK